MIEYKLVDQKPEKLSKKEFVVYRPNFLTEVKRARGRTGNNGVTTLNRLRDIFIEIGNSYDDKFSAYRDVNLSNFLGLSYETDEDLSEIICSIVDDQVGYLVDKAIDDQIKKMPSSVELIYYVAKDLKNTSVFSKLHIRMYQEKKDKKQKENETSSETEV